MIKQISKYLNPLFSVLSQNVTSKHFKTYLLGLIQDDRYHSPLGISRKTKNVKLWKLYELLKQKINWKKLFNEHAKAFLKRKNQESWYLIIDASPL